MADEIRCPWCGNFVVLIASYTKSQYGDVKESKCPHCNQLVAVRLAGVPDDIIIGNRSR